MEENKVMNLNERDITSETVYKGKLAMFVLIKRRDDMVAVWRGDGSVQIKENPFAWDGGAITGYGKELRKRRCCRDNEQCTFSHRYTAQNSLLREIALSKIFDKFKFDRLRQRQRPGS